MQSGPEQLLDWQGRRGFNKSEAAEYLGFDVTFYSKLINGHRNPGLTNAITIERRAGIPVEAWQSSELDESVTTGSETSRKPR